jgi:hypothetical protein
VNAFRRQAELTGQERGKAAVAAVDHDSGQVVQLQMMFLCQRANGVAHGIECPDAQLLSFEMHRH